MILLDTCALLWLVNGGGQLTQTALEEIDVDQPVVQRVALDIANHRHPRLLVSVYLEGNKRIAAHLGQQTIQHYRIRLKGQGFDVRSIEVKRGYTLTAQESDPLARNLPPIGL